MTQDFFQTFILLVLVTDPFGNVPLFASVLNPVPPARRSRIVIRECAIAFVLLLIFMFFGRHFLAALHLSEVALRIGGAVILLLISIRMIFPHPDGVLGRTDGESRSSCRWRSPRWPVLPRWPPCFCSPARAPAR